jgi:predicted Zn-dependent protease
LLPLELTADPDEADIIFDWSSGTDGESHAGEEQDWVQFNRVGDESGGRRVANIRVDISRNWSKDEMRAIVLHELGHALGIKGHSDSKGDIMYYQMQDNPHRVYIPRVIVPIEWKSLVSKPSQRDLNTLIRLYNAPGSIVRLQ